MKSAPPPALEACAGGARIGRGGRRPTYASAMPMIDLTFPEGALSEEALDGLADSLMRALLRSEHVPEDNAARELVSWVHMHELPARRMYAGARRLEAGEPFFRLDVSIPAGVVDADDKAASSPRRLGSSSKRPGPTRTTAKPPRASGSSTARCPAAGGVRPPALAPADREDRRRERGARGQGRGRARRLITASRVGHQPRHSARLLLARGPGRVGRVAAEGVEADLLALEVGEEGRRVARDVRGRAAAVAGLE